jgi:hypothetical protein
MGTNAVLQLRYVAGQGKTQLSLEYCRAERTENSIFWVDATSMATVNRSFEGIALKLAPGSKISNPEVTRTFVLKKLEDLSEPVLMIFDNYDKPAEFLTIRDYLPHRSKIIFNSRHTDARRLGKEVEIGAMTAEVSMLRSAFSRVKCSAPVAKTRLSERIARFIDFSRC